ncbi:hypothetical protein RUND412_007842 [Rhizina undulata]
MTERKLLEDRMTESRTQAYCAPTTAKSTKIKRNLVEQKFSLGGGEQQNKDSGLTLYQRQRLAVYVEEGIAKQEHKRVDGRGASYRSGLIT